MSSRFLSLSVGGLGLCLILAAVGCGGGGSSSAQVRVLQASPNTPVVNVLVDGTTDNTNLGYGANTGYISVKSGSRRIEVQEAGSNTTIVDQTITLSNSGAATLIVTGLAPSVSPLVLTDDNAAPATGTALVRLVNAAPSMGPADVYVVASGTSLTPGSPTVPGLTFGQASGYESITIPTGTSNTDYSIYFTEAGTTLAYLNTGAITLTAGQIRTVVALNSLSGGFNAVVLSDLN
jgi:Domain of unknown function (DUF4397)